MAPPGFYRKGVRGLLLLDGFVRCFLNTQEARISRTQGSSVLRHQYRDPVATGSVLGRERVRVTVDA